MSRVSASLKQLSALDQKTLPDLYHLYLLMLIFILPTTQFFQNIRNILQEPHLLLLPDEGHKKVFPNVPAVGFRNGNSSADYLVRVALLKTSETVRCEGCIIF